MSPPRVVITRWQNSRPMPLPPLSARVVTGSRVSRLSTSGGMPGPLSVTRRAGCGLRPGSMATRSSAMCTRGCAGGSARRAIKAFLTSVHSTRYSRSRRPGSVKSATSSTDNQPASAASNGYSACTARTSSPARRLAEVSPRLASRAVCTKVDTNDCAYSARRCAASIMNSTSPGFCCAMCAMPSLLSGLTRWFSRMAER